jgi:hypothetical protein
MRRTTSSIYKLDSSKSIGGEKKVYEEESYMKKKTSVLKELQTLGKELKEAYRGALASDEMKHLEKDVSRSAGLISKRIREALGSAKKSPHTKKLGRSIKTIGRIVKQESLAGARRTKGYMMTSVEKVKRTIKK